MGTRMPGAAAAPPTPGTLPLAPTRMVAVRLTPLGRGPQLPTPTADRRITLKVQARPPPATATVAVRPTPRDRGLRLPTPMAGRHITRKVLERQRRPMPMVGAPRTIKAKAPSVRLLPARQS